jgi:RNase adapter protein RapZ
MPPSLESLILITGLSGAGKSTALAALEDMGYFCVDNLPLHLLNAFLKNELAQKTHPLLAVHMDARDAGFFRRSVEFLPGLKKKIPRLQVLFLTASDAALLRRFSETRRRHPLTKRGDLRKAILDERRLAEPLRKEAHRIIDTTHMNVHALKAALEASFGSPRKRSRLPLGFVSFGYRYGIPPQCDLVLDVRFLPNPYFNPDMKSLDGTHRKVQDFVLKRPETRRFIQKVEALLRFLIPQYRREGKSYLTVGFGCTGGKHRSVSLVNYFKNSFEKKGWWVNVEHRDLHRP